MHKAFETTAQKVQDTIDQVFFYKMGYEDVGSAMGDIFAHDGIHKGAAVKACLSLIYQLLPDKQKDLITAEYTKNFPLAIQNSNLEAIGSGGANTVFRNSNLPEAYIFCVNRNNCNSTKEAFEEAQTIKNDYAQIKEIYAELPDLIPSEDYFLGENKKRQPLVMSIRRFVDGDIKDIFTDYTQVELKALLSENPTLAQQLNKFVEITTRNNAFFIQNEVDIIGKKNLSIVTNGNNAPNLVFLDPHTVAERHRNDQHKEIITQRLEYLENIIKQS